VGGRVGLDPAVLARLALGAERDVQAAARARDADDDVGGEVLVGKREPDGVRADLALRVDDGLDPPLDVAHRLAGVGLPGLQAVTHLQDGVDVVERGDLRPGGHRAGRDELHRRAELLGDGALGLRRDLIAALARIVERLLVDGDLLEVLVVERPRGTGEIDGRRPEFAGRIDAYDQRLTASATAVTRLDQPLPVA
jgi:hypothetical protein